MTSINFLELLTALSVQTFVIVLATHLSCRAVKDERIQGRLWEACFWMLLLAVGVAVTLPHVRWGLPRPEFDRGTVASIVLWEMRIGRMAMVVWGLGAVVAFVASIVRWYRIHRFLKSCDTVDDALLTRLLESPTGKTALNLGEARLLTSPDIASPFCTQFHRPYIVLPTYLLSFDSAELVQIIRHEMEHIRTGHPLQLFIQRIAELLFWFHPMVWWAVHQSELHREFVCDRAATETPDRIVGYLKTLLHVVEHTNLGRVSQPLSFRRSKGNIARRAERLVQRAQEPNSVTVRRFLRFVIPVFAVISLTVTQFWVPLNLLASSRSHWSPWPPYTAQVLHDFGFAVRDYEVYHHDSRLQEILEPGGHQQTDR